LPLRCGGADQARSRDWFPHRQLGRSTEAGQQIVVSSNCLFAAAERAECPADIEIRIDKIWLDRDHFLESGKRL
jgi:hypothetical protein